MSDTDDYYKILGVGKNATDKEIKAAYRKQAMKWHPDKNPDDRDKAEAMFKKVAEANDVLSDKSKRDAYDMYGKEGAKQSTGGGGPNVRVFRTGNVDPNEMFSRIFGRDPFGGLGGFGGIHPNFASRRAPGQQASIHCSLDELYKGTIKRLKVGGEQLEVNILPGYKEGTKITYRGKIPSRHPGVQPGDLILIIKENQHPVFTRVNNDGDISMTLRLTLSEALTGFSKTIQTISGKKKRVSMDQIPKIDYKIELPGDGMATRKNGKMVGYGKLILNIAVSIPSLTEKQRADIKSILSE